VGVRFGEGSGNYGLFPGFLFIFKKKNGGSSMAFQKQWVAGAAILCFAGLAPTAHAAAVESVNFSGFLSAGASTASHPVLPNTDAVLADGSVDASSRMEAYTRFGLQISAQVNPNVSMTGQLLALPTTTFGSGTEFKVFADWAYVKYRFSDSISLRAGRVKLPSFLISDYYEVGYAYPWLRPPVEMYSANPMTGLNGVDLLIRKNFGEYSLLVQPFYGSNSQETTVPQAVIQSGANLCLTPPPPAGPVGGPTYTSCPAGTIISVPFSVEGLRGINLSLGSDIFTVRGSWFKTRVYQSDFGVDGDNGSFTSLGFTMDWKNIVVYTEGFIRVVEGNAGMAFPSQKGGYATLGYRFGKILPHLTYGWIEPHDSSLGVQFSEHSYALGLRYELGRGAALKLDVTRLTPDQGTTGLLVSDPNGPLAPHPSDSIYIYGAGIDVVF
jgi:hypothetical protein